MLLLEQASSLPFLPPFFFFDFPFSKSKSASCCWSLGLIRAVTSKLENTQVEGRRKRQKKKRKEKRDENSIPQLF